MALHDVNPRVAIAASWGLAAACHAQRHKKSPTGASSADTAVGAQMQALAGLLEDGAMRPLVQAVLAGKLFCRGFAAPFGWTEQ